MPPPLQRSEHSRVYAVCSCKKTTPYRLPTLSRAPAWPLRWLIASVGRDSRPRGAGAAEARTTSFVDSTLSAVDVLHPE